jgi:hypothetical protein
LRPLFFVSHSLFQRVDWVRVKLFTLQEVCRLARAFFGDGLLAFTPRRDVLEVVLVLASSTKPAAATALARVVDLVLPRVFSRLIYFPITRALAPTPTM